MGEKYCDDDDEPRWRLRPDLLRWIGNPFGEGYPPAREPEMLAGGPGGLAAASEYLDEPSKSLADFVHGAVPELHGAGNDPSGCLRAVQSITDQLDGRVPVVQKKLAEGDAMVERLRAAGTYPSGQLGGAQRDANRKFQGTVNQDLGALGRAVQETLSVVEDRAKDVVATRFEAAVNRFGQVAHRHAARMYRGLLREEPGDAVEPGGSAA